MKTRCHYIEAWSSLMFSLNTGRSVAALYILYKPSTVKGDLCVSKIEIYMIFPFLEKGCNQSRWIFLYK